MLPAGRRQKPAPDNVVGMALVHAHAAGIDIGRSEHVVAVPQDCLPEGGGGKRVRTFGTMTCHLAEIAAFLSECRITTVAMESTGVYWKPLFSLLARKGFEVHLVNSRDVKNVTGRKTDEDDAMWIQKLHSCGLLRSSFLPGAEQEALRVLVRYRKTLTQDSGRFVNRMQKAMEQMNIKFHTVIADITGKSGLAVVDAIVSGVRDSQLLLPLIDPGVKATPEVIRQSLEGNWLPEQLYLLRENLAMYRHFLAKMLECDLEIEASLLAYEASRNGGVVVRGEMPAGATGDGARPKGRAKKDPGNQGVKKKGGKKQKSKNSPKFDVREYLGRIYGTDILAIYGLSDLGGLMLLAEVGTDLSRWETVGHFASWLNLCPNTKKSGGKVISSRMMRKKAGFASQAFRQAAVGVSKSDNWLGDYFRRIKGRGGYKHAIVATAHKIAVIFYHMVTNKEEFSPAELDKYQEKHKQSKIAYLEKKLRQLKGEAA